MPSTTLAAGPPPAVPPPLPPVVRVTPWVDPVVDRSGHDPRSAYVEQFWIAVLGPTATWLLRRLVTGFDRAPDGYELDVEHTARSLGLSVAKGGASPFARSLQRCVMFGMAAQRGDGWVVRRRLPVLSQRHLARLPEPLQALHASWTRATVTLGELERAHAIATAMVRAGDDPGLVERQLIAVGCAPAAAEQACHALRGVATPD